MKITQKLANLFFPSPRSNGKSSDAHRNDLPANQDNNNSEPLSRCQFTFSDGRRCRNQHAQFCIHHASNKRPSTGVVEPEKGVAITPLFGHEKVGLEALCGDLTTATNINRALSQVFLLMAQGRIAQKQAVAFGYLSQLLLQTVPGIRSEFVSVFGYSAWQNHLKSKVAPFLPAPGPLPESPASSPQPLAAPATSPVAEKEVPPASISPATPSPDYNNIYRRSLDLLDRKFDTTPEGRREANALMAEFKVIDHARAKARKDLPHSPLTSSPSSGPAAAESKTGVVNLSKQGERSALLASRPVLREISETPSSTRPELSPVDKVNKVEQLAADRTPSSVASATAFAPSEREDHFVAPPSRRPPESRAQMHGAARPSAPRDEEPALANREEPASARKPSTPTFTTHTTDWYAPASWSRPGNRRWR